MRKKLLSLILSMVIVLGYPIQASADNFLEGETGTVEETEDGVYELENSNGTLLLMFIEDDGSAVMPRSRHNVNWTIDATSVKCSSREFSILAESPIHVDLNFSRVGITYIGVYDRETSNYLWVKRETRECKGTMVTHGRDALLSFAIKNASGHSMTYTGSYSY